MPVVGGTLGWLLMVALGRQVRDGQGDVVVPGYGELESLRERN